MVWSQHNRVWIQDRLTVWDRIPRVECRPWGSFTGTTSSGIAPPRARWTPPGSSSAKRPAPSASALNRVRVAPGKLPTPPHSHGASEEIYYVLGGSGLAWQDEQVHEVRAGDCVIHRADEMEHTFIAGPDGLDCLVFGTRHPTEFGWLPRSGAVRIGWPWVEGRVDDPWDVEAEGPPLEVGEPAPRPAEHRQHRRGRARRHTATRHRAARDRRALGAGRLPLGAAVPGRDRRTPALPLRGGGGLRDARGRRHAGAVAVAPRGVLRQRPRGRADPGRPRGRAAARDAHRALLPGRGRTA